MELHYSYLRRSKIWFNFPSTAAIYRGCCDVMYTETTSGHFSDVVESRMFHVRAWAIVNWMTSLPALMRAELNSYNLLSWSLWPTCNHVWCMSGPAISTRRKMDVVQLIFLAYNNRDRERRKDAVTEREIGNDIDNKEKGQISGFWRTCVQEK